MSDYNWSDLPSMVSSLWHARRGTVAARREVLMIGPGVAQTIAHAHSIAGAEDAEASQRGHEMLRCAQDIEHALETIEIRLKQAGVFAKRAADALDEDEARRKAARTKLGA